MLQKKSPELWMPGQGDDLSDEYPVSTQDELTQKWQEYNPQANLLEAPGVFGVVAEPATKPEVFVSLDMCEVMRDSHLAIRSILFANEERFAGNIHLYAAGTCLEQAADITAVLRVLMDKGLVKPVPGIEEIAEIVKEAADQGAYIFANTSTLPGCELGTVEFLKQNIPIGIQGIAFPRNHYGDLPLTKGHVFRNVIDKFSQPDHDILAIKIDDSPHHNIAARAEVKKRPNSEVITIMPEYPTHFNPDTESIISPTPLAAFQAMRRVLQERLA